MRNINRLLCFGILFFFSVNVFAEKYAIIIAVGDYEPRTGWGKVSSKNDIPLIKGALEQHEFLEENILILKDSEATREGILAALEKLKSQVKPGDIVVIHYSGHGQQMWDTNGDEADDKDESIVPFDALAEYTFNYKGQNHIRDDELGNIIANFRNVLGKDGQLFMLFDSCYSGTLARGGKARGGQNTFAPPNWSPNVSEDRHGAELFEKVDLKSDSSPFIMITGASADELNYEYQGHGSLSYAFSEAMNELGSDFTYRKLFSVIAANMNVIAPYQTPTIEGDADYKLFKGEYVKQQPYFQINRIQRSDLIKINAGMVQRLLEESTIVVLPAGSQEIEKEKIISKGTVIRSMFNESIVKLDTPLNSSNEKEFWIFLDKLSYGDLSINLYFDKSFKSKPLKTQLKEFLSENQIGEITDDSLKADLILKEAKNNSKLLIVAKNGSQELHNQRKKTDSYDLEYLKESIFNYAQGSYLKKLKFDNLNYEFDFKLLPAKFDNPSGKALLIDENEFTNEFGRFQVNTTSDAAVLQVTNKSSRPLYFNIIEINSKGEIAPFMPNDNCFFDDTELKILPGITKTFESCVFRFGPPYETLILKGFATSSPIYFRSTIKSRGNASLESDNDSPLARFLGQTYSKSRGSVSTGMVDGYSTEFIYEIIEEK